MLYDLLSPLAETFLVFNLFRYLTFRTGGAILTALAAELSARPAGHPLAGARRAAASRSATTGRKPIC